MYTQCTERQGYDNTDLVFFKKCSTKNPMNNILQNCNDMIPRKKVSQTFWNNALNQ